MRSLPPPRKSRSRALRKFFDQVFKILTLQFIFKRRGSVFIVKRRKTPFHFTSRKFKVKTSRGAMKGAKKKHWYSSRRKSQQQLVTTLILQELKSKNSNSIQGEDKNSKTGMGSAHMDIPRRLRRLKINTSVPGQRVRNAFRRFVYFVFTGRRLKRNNCGRRRRILKGKDVVIVV